MLRLEDHGQGICNKNAETAPFCLNKIHLLFSLLHWRKILTHIVLPNSGTLAARITSPSLPLAKQDNAGQTFRAVKLMAKKSSSVLSRSC